MAINAGQDIVDTDFIDYSEKDATPANDAGRVPKLESDGKLHGFFTKNGAVVNAGETLNGATLPVPVYQNKTDNELYACDANDNTRYKFIGFVTSNSTNGNPIVLQVSGIVGGFSSLDEGEKYYVQDAVGTIGTTPGTQEILVGVAISTTELFIQKGRRVASGTTSFSSTTTSAITLGFRPSVVRVYAVGGSNSWDSVSQGGWNATSGNKCVYTWRAEDGSGSGDDVDTNAWRTQLSTTHSHVGTITSVTDIGFTLSNVKTNSPSNVNLFWEAEGDL